jgi:hypothetical protein
MPCPQCNRKTQRQSTQIDVYCIHPSVRNMDATARKDLGVRIGNSVSGKKFLEASLLETHIAYFYSLLFCFLDILPFRLRHYAPRAFFASRTLHEPGLASANGSEPVVGSRRLSRVIVSHGGRTSFWFCAKRAGDFSLVMDSTGSILNRPVDHGRAVFS